MNKLRVYAEDELPVFDQYPVGSCQVTALRRATWTSPEEYALWMCRAEIGPGATMAWTAAHSDEGVYVIEGELTVGDQPCPAGGAVIIESGVAITAKSPIGATIIHVGSADVVPPADGPLGSPAPAQHVHVVGPEGWYQSGSKDRVEAIWFADSTCPTCRIAFFTVRSKPAPFWAGPAHSHTQDEIIHVLEGSVRLGAREYGPGTTLCVPGDVHYALSFGEGGALFTNYRRDWSEQSFYDKGRLAKVEPESGLSRGGTLVGQVVHVGAPA
jgi:quercetin dioxygenase-like cupin family protein